jgi:hypothetical protein
VGRKWGSYLSLLPYLVLLEDESCQLVAHVHHFLGTARSTFLVKSNCFDLVFCKRLMSTDAGTWKITARTSFGQSALLTQHKLFYVAANNSLNI